MPKVISRILQFFDKDLMTELNSIAMDVLIPDNNTKVKKMNIVLDKHNVPYSELGPGTNRYAIQIDGYVFKIAMDKAGVIDNWAEFSLSQELQPFVTKTYECNGLIAVAERVTVIDKATFNNSKDQIRQILSHLAESYLLGDVGAVTKNFMNWGYTKDDSLVILDYAYIYRIIGDEMICGGLNNDDSVCDSNLSYDENFHKLRCPKCGKSYTFHDIRRKIDRKYETKEREYIKQVAYKLTSPSQIIDGESDTPTNNKGDETMSKHNKYWNIVPETTEPEDTIDVEEEYRKAIELMRSLNSQNSDDHSVIPDNIDDVSGHDDVDTESSDQPIEVDIQSEDSDESTIQSEDTPVEELADAECVDPVESGTTAILNDCAITIPTDNGDELRALLNDDDDSEGDDEPYPDEYDNDSYYGGIVKFGKRREYK